MRVLHVATTLGPKNGGAAVACIELCVALAARGHHVEIFTTTLDIPPDWDVQPGQPFLHRGVTIRFFPIFGVSYYWFSPALVGALWKMIRTFDLIHIHSLYRFHLPVTAWICRFFGRPYVVKPHGSLNPFLFKYRRWRKLPHELLLDRPAYAHAAAIQYVSEEERRLSESTKFITGLKTTSVVVPSAVVVLEGTAIGEAFNGEVETFGYGNLVSKFPELKDKVIVLFLGRLNFVKGIDILIAAFAQVHKIIPNAHLLLVGPDSDGYTQQIKTWLNEHDVAGKTTFGGMLLGNDKLAAFRLASVFVLSSYSENFGITIIEAMVQRCPVVISNKVNIWREIEEAKAGLVTDCDASQVATGILRVLKDRQLAASLVENGARLAKDRFTWSASAAKMETVYNDILAARPILQSGKG